MSHYPITNIDDDSYMYIWGPYIIKKGPQNLVGADFYTYCDHGDLLLKQNLGLIYQPQTQCIEQRITADGSIR